MKTFLALMLLCASVNAQTILKYGHLSLMRETVNAPITGDFLSPMGQFAYTPFTFRDNIVALDNTASMDFSYAFVHGTVSTDANKGIALEPEWFVGGFIGGGTFQNNQINLGHGVIGLFVGKPSLLGNVALAGADDLETGRFSVGISTVWSFDVLGGFGLIQL